MFTASIQSAPSREVSGLVSRVLLQQGDTGDSALTVTWVEVAPGASQAMHEHPPEQVYGVISGSGRTHVGDEERELVAGDLALAPSGVTHGIVNTGAVVLVYISAATPAFGVTDLYDTGTIG
jgi:mannose-6-phosphate isomerase-like protein (cupin superfamily)